MKLKSISKEEQVKFKKKLEDFFSNPLSIIPQMLDSSLFCPITGYAKKLEKMRAKNDFSYSGSDGFLSAVSETFKLMSTDTPILGLIKTPYGTVHYGKRGNADEKLLAGIQNYDNDVWRMLAFSNVVLTKNVKIYSSKNYFLASCKNTPPPMEFFKDVLEEEGIKYSGQDEIEIGQEDPSFYMKLFGSITIIVHRESRYKTGYSILKHMLINDPYKEIRVGSTFLEECSQPDISGDVRRYLAGEYDDKYFLSKVIQERQSYIVKNGLYGIDQKCFDSIDSFISNIPGAMDYAPYLKRYSKGIYLEAPALGKLMDLLWPEIGEEISRDKAGMDFKSFQDMQSYLMRESRKGKVTFEPWSPDSAFLADLIKQSQEQGVNNAILQFKDMARTHVQKAILYAFNIIAGGPTIGYVFSDDDVVLGNEVKGIIELIVKGESVEENLKKLRAYIP
ncbi:TVG1516240 [Thermoplasma volcanium GSS1]|uniref:TVG1516240 protein n=1 Tax=Thermoplasma volcanium (strain ATCC 51530 / DSM 4299 / JCM 9571 / NBRC 15438 / GSS1) TaxID=273116 RepID=Q978F0_THEVO|nr:hypothetical protein [Thermoplasma volcanium]BAB60609.1 TVG1516240 [Thermoplasma volcanium GSS1]